MSVLDNLTEGLRIYAQIQASKAAIKAAPPGTVVDAGTVKGIKAFGRVLDLPVQPLVRK